jgi:hypothetical protein
MQRRRVGTALAEQFLGTPEKTAPIVDAGQRIFQRLAPLLLRVPSLRAQQQQQ